MLNERNLVNKNKNIFLNTKTSFLIFYFQLEDFMQKLMQKVSLKRGETSALLLHGNIFPREFKIRCGSITRQVGKERKKSNFAVH